MLSVFNVAAKFHITQTIRFRNPNPFVRLSDCKCYLLSTSAVAMRFGAEMEIILSLSICSFDLRGICEREEYEGRRDASLLWVKPGFVACISSKAFWYAVESSLRSSDMLSKQEYSSGFSGFFFLLLSLFLNLCGSQKSGDEF